LGKRARLTRNDCLISHKNTFKEKTVRAKAAWEQVGWQVERVRAALCGVRRVVGTGCPVGTEPGMEWVSRRDRASGRACHQEIPHVLQEHPTPFFALTVFWQPLFHTVLQEVAMCAVACTCFCALRAFYLWSFLKDNALLFSLLLQWSVSDEPL
jgi:hypothetical protein